jgi:hypothetical protein
MAEKRKSVCVSCVFFFGGFSSCQLFRHYVAKNVKNSLKHLLSYLDYSQIWLILLVNDCQFGYVTKLEKKTTITIPHENLNTLIGCQVASYNP